MVGLEPETTPCVSMILGRHVLQRNSHRSPKQNMEYPFSALANLVCRKIHPTPQVMERKRPTEKAASVPSRFGVDPQYLHSRKLAHKCEQGLDEAVPSRFLRTLV